MDKDTLILIAGQLTKDKLSMIEMHEQLIERLGNTQEAEDYVYNEHLGKYIPILESLIDKICLCATNKTAKVDPKEYVLIAAQLQNDKNQMDKIVAGMRAYTSIAPEMPRQEHERFILWESELLESLIATFQNNFQEP